MDLKQKDDNAFVPARRNPFATEHVTNIAYRFERGTWQSHLLQLRELNYHAAIVGPQGSGKTTLMNELREHLQRHVQRETVYLFLPNEKQERDALVEATFSDDLQYKILLVDGIERLSLMDRLKMFNVGSKAEGFVVTSHHPLRLPPFRLRTWIRTQPNELLLDYLLSELRMDSPEVREAGKKFYRVHNGNLRNVLRDLYDRHASLRFK